MIYSISTKLYQRVAELLLEAVEDRDYFSGVVDFLTEDGVKCELVVSCVVCRRSSQMPEGEGRAISSIIPVWWEFRTSCPAGVLDNDFSFRELNLENIC